MNEDNESDIVQMLKELQTEFAQLSELDELEDEYARKLVDSMKVAISQMNVAVPVNVEMLQGYFRDVKKAYIVSDALHVIADGEETKTRHLLSLDKDLLIMLLQDAIPRVSQMLAKRRKRAEERVRLFELILKHLKRAEPPIKKGKDEIDIVQSSVPSE